MQTLSRQGRWSLVAICVGTLALLLWLPYQFPVVPTFSDSYLFGFSNHVGLLIILAFATAVALCTRRWTLPNSSDSPEYRLSHKSLAWALGLMLLASGALALATGKLEGIEESIYLIDRLKLVLEGRTPGTGFEFAYGPFMLYGPAFLARFLHLGAGGAYGVFWVTLNLLGIVELYCTLQWVDLPFRLRRPTFLFFLAVTFAELPCTGTNYSLFRFITPPFFALVVYHLLCRTPFPSSRWLGILSVAPLYAALLTISPELALAFACGMCLFILLFLDLGAPRTLFCFLALLTALALTTWAAAHLQVFATLNAFRTGGFNFPIVPAPHILLFLIALAFVSSYFFQRLRLRGPDAVVVLTLVSGGSVVGALGRCDPVHVLLNPLGCWIAAFVLAGNFHAFGRGFIYAAGCVFVLLNAPFSLYGRAANLSKAALPTIFATEPENSDTAIDRFIEMHSAKLFGPEKARAKLAEIRFFAHHGGLIDLDRLYGYPPGTIFEAPFSYTPSRFGTLYTPQIDPGFYLGMENVLTREAVRRKLAEFADHPDRPLLMLAGQENFCALDPEGERHAITRLFFYPYRARAKNPVSIQEPVCAFIRTHYRMAIAASPEHFGYALWRRLPGGN